MKTKLTQRKWTDILIAVLFMMALLWMCASCSPDPYWAIQKKTVTGKHNYMRAGWGTHIGCPSASKVPLKTSTYWRYKTWRPSKRY